MAAGDMTKHEDVFGTLNVVHGTVEGPSSYAAGGFATNPVKFGLTTVEFCSLNPVESAATLAFMPRYDHASGKIKLFEANTADAALVEVDDATDLDSVEIRFMALGRK